MTSAATKAPGEPPAGPDASLLKVNLGCGVIALAGWENYDKSPVQLLRKFPLLVKLLVKTKVLTSGHIQTWPESVQRRDLTKPLPLADGSVGAIYSSHMLEHIFMDDARRLVAECFRVMAPGGIVRLALPDGELWARQLVESSGDAAAGHHYNERLGSYPPIRPRGRRMITFIGGGSAHKWQPTRGLVRELLEDAGFTNVRELGYRQGDLPEINEIEVREESMFFEAVRP